jgi:hypothetical protein
MRGRNLLTPTLTHITLAQPVDNSSSIRTSRPIRRPASRRTRYASHSIALRAISCCGPLAPQARPGPHPYQGQQLAPTNPLCGGQTPRSAMNKVGGAASAQHAPKPRRKSAKEGRQGGKSAAGRPWPGKRVGGGRPRSTQAQSSKKIALAAIRTRESWRPARSAACL